MTGACCEGNGRGGALVMGAMRAPTATATAGKAPLWQRTCAAMTTKTAMFRETPLLLPLPLLLWGKRCCTGRMRRRERRQTTPNVFTNERGRRTGGNGVM